MLRRSVFSAITPSSAVLIRNSQRTFVRSMPPRLGELGSAKIEIHGEAVARVLPTAGGSVVFVGQNIGFPSMGSSTADQGFDLSIDDSDGTTAEMDDTPLTRES